MTITTETPRPKPTRTQRLMRVNWPFVLALAALAVWLTACDSARGTDSGPALEIVDEGPPISVDGPRYRILKNGQDIRDGYGGRLEYRDPVVAGVVLERLAMGDTQCLYTVVQHGGHWGVRYDTDQDNLGPSDVTVAQNDATGLATQAPLTAGEATFQIAAQGDVEWYLDGAPVGQGPSVTIDLAPGQQTLSAVVTGYDGGTQVVDVPLYVEPSIAKATLQWDIPTQRENGAALPVSELCCYQVTYITGNTLGLVDVAGGATREVIIELEPGFYRFSIVAIDTEGLTSAPSEAVEADLT